MADECDGAGHLYTSARRQRMGLLALDLGVRTLLLADMLMEWIHVGSRHGRFLFFSEALALWVRYA